MANKTLLDAVNEILTRVGFIAGDAGELATLTDSARQPAIDVAIQVVNEGISDLYTACEKAMPQEQAEATLVLVLNTRAYSLATGMVQIRWPMIDRTNTQFIANYPGDYNDMLSADPEQDDTGLPMFGTIRPTDSKLFLDRAPTSVEAGRTYYYQYDKDLTLTLAASAVPFIDTVFHAMVPAWVQLWKREKRNEFDGDLFKKSMGLAARYLSQQQPRSNYSPRG
jgi:hypothetical protein